MKSITGSVLSIMLLLIAATDAQWIGRPTAGIPRTAGGKPNLSARAPRTPAGKPDFSGIWQPDPGPGATRGIGETYRSKYFLNITADHQPNEVPFEPWAATLFTQHVATLSKDDPTARCLPTGIPGLDTYPQPYKIVQTPGLMIVLYENNTTFRQIFMDGRDHPHDPQPTWMVYSIGKWDGDTLIVDTIGFNDRSWLDRVGHPHSESMRVTERFRRSDFGHMTIQITIDDPKAYTKPLVFTQPQVLLADTELLEYFCAENEKDVGHFK